MPNAVICIAKTPHQAETLVTRLKDVVVSAADISLLLPDRPTLNHFVAEHYARVPGSATFGGSAGGLAGGVFGLLAGVGVLAIPGAGLFIAAGPIIAALSGAALGAAMGGISGALIGMGLPEFEARSYEAKVKDGSTLLSVRTRRISDARRIKRIMEWAQAEDIAVISAAAAG